MTLSPNLLFITATTLYQLLSVVIERRQPLPGRRVDIGGYALHLYEKGENNGQPTIIFEHSLGGIEGYLLIDQLAQFTKVCAYDRAGFGWSDRSPNPRTSQFIVQELEALLTQAKILPPYILMGDSFGSFNVRLYTHQFPQKVSGIILTDGLHEVGMLQMPFSLRFLKLFFLSGFLMSILGSSLGIIRLLATLRCFELLKRELLKFSPDRLQAVKRSFCRPKHWLTMAQEIWHLNQSSRQVQVANNLGNIPIVSIKAGTFLKRSPLNFYMPIGAADRLREQMHGQLLKLSTRCTQLNASQSGHFVWVDQPEVMLKAVQLILEQL